MIRLEDKEGRRLGVRHKVESKKQRLFYRFLKCLCGLNPIEFYGIAKTLQVGTSALEGDTEEILSETIDAFIKLKLPMQKAIVRNLESVIREEDTESDIKIEEGREHGEVSENLRVV